MVMTGEDRREICTETLKRARRRYAGGEVPITCLDEELTGETIYDLTCDFDRDTRLCLLTSTIGNLVTAIRPFEDRTHALIDIPRLLRKHVKDLAKNQEYCQQPLKNAGRGGGRPNVRDGFLDPSNISLADVAFDRAFRRRAGEYLEITKDDLDGTFALIHHLMTDIDCVVLIVVTAKAIVEEYDGHPPEGVMTQIDNLLRKLVVASDSMNLSYDGPMN